MAHCEANIDKLTSSAADLRISVADLAVVLRESVKLSDDRFARIDDKLNKLADAQRAADGRSARFDERMIELTTAQKTTDDRLNALINITERHITGPDHAPRP